MREEEEGREDEEDGREDVVVREELNAERREVEEDEEEVRAVLLEARVDAGEVDGASSSPLPFPTAPPDVAPGAGAGDSASPANELIVKGPLCE